MPRGEDHHACETRYVMVSSEGDDPSLAAPGRSLMYALASLVTVAHREYPHSSILHLRAGLQLAFAAIILQQCRELTSAICSEHPEWHPIVGADRCEAARALAVRWCDAAGRLVPRLR